MTRLYDIMKMMEHLRLDELQALRELLTALIQTRQRESREPGATHDNEREVVA